MNAIFKPKLYVVFKKGYTWKLFQKDFWAGMIVACVALPVAIAFAVASGVPPENGLITAIIAGFIVSLLGGSRFQISGPSAIFVVIAYGIVEHYGVDGLIISTVMAGTILLGFGLLRLGTIIKFIPHPLIVGFTSGVALIIISNQLKDALGLQNIQLPGEFAGIWMTYFTHFGQINLYAVAVTIITIIGAVYGPKIIRKIPGSIITLTLVTLFVTLLELPVQTVHSVFGNPTGILLIHMPHFEFDLLAEYIQPAFTIAILGAIKSLLSAVVADGMTSSTHRSNTELIAQGIANIVTPFFGGLPSTGGVTRTAVNIKNGARTPIAGIVQSTVLLLVFFFLVKWIPYIPMACIAGIMIVIAYNISDWRSFVTILKGSKYDIIILLTSFFLTVVVNLTIALEVGMVLAAMLFMQRMSKLSNIEQVDIDTDIIENYSALPKGVDVYEISGPLFFAAAQSYKEALKQIAGSKVLILRMRHVPFIDSTGLRDFQDVIRDFKIRKVAIVLSGVPPKVRKTLINCGLAAEIGNDLICDNFGDAVKKASEELEKLRWYKK